MGFDRNTIIGFVLIGLLMVGMLFFNNRDSQAYQKEQKRIADSLAFVRKSSVDTSTAIQDSIHNAALRAAEQQKGLPAEVINAPEQFTELQNDLLKITFTNKGAQPKLVELKKFFGPDGKPVILQNGVDNKISYPIQIGGTIKETSAINFPVTNKTNSGTDQVISFVLTDSAGKKLEHIYTLHADNYMIDFAIKMDGKWAQQNVIDLKWETVALQAENSSTYENQQSSVNYVEDGNFDFYHLGTGNDKKFEKPVDWLALKQQFFLSFLGAKNKFQSADISWKVPADSTKKVALATANFKLAVAPEMQLQLFYGPSDYNVLKKYNNHMDQIVPYGSGIFSFVKYINRYFLLPVWDFLRSFIPSYGMVILLLTLLIRLLTSPILYKSYVSSAKMKVLKPEIDVLKAKYKDDQQAFSMEQMKLWKTAGVSPLGGCLPALLQIPIFMSLFYFFQANISLRGQSFLWAKDLAAWDSIAHLPFSIPFYGDHVSLFTLTAVATSLLISIYSMNNMQDNSNPLMKYMPYIFPVLLLGVFNKLPAALTWYYTVSNTITLILQIVIQKYIINHDKLKAQIEENKKRPVKQSKLAERMQAMQEANKKMQDQKGKGNQGKR